MHFCADGGTLAEAHRCHYLLLTNNRIPIIGMGWNAGYAGWAPNGLEHFGSKQPFSFRKWFKLVRPKINQAKNGPAKN